MDQPSSSEAHPTGKLTKYRLLKQLYEQKQREVNSLRVKLTTAEAQCEKMTQQLDMARQELTSLEHQQQLDLLHGGGGGGGVDPRVIADIHNELEMMSVVETAEEEQRATSTVVPFSVTRELLMAAMEVKQLEDRHEMMKTMLIEKDLEVRNLKFKLAESYENRDIQLSRIDQLTTEIVQLREKMPTSDIDDVFMTSLSPSSLSTSALDELSVSDVISMDPATLRDRLQQLTTRVKELMSNNERWKLRCDRLYEEVEAAKQQLVNSLLENQQKLDEEKLKTSRAVVERDEALAEAERQRDKKDQSELLCRQLSADVARLESTICELEQRLNVETASTTTSDEMVAVRLQMEECRLDLEAERESHQRTKANVESLEQMWRNMYQELRDKQDELRTAETSLEQLDTDIAVYRNLLQQANIDKELIQSSLQAKSSQETSASTTRSTSERVLPPFATRPPPPAVHHQKTSQKQTTSSEPIRGVLEPDQPHASVHKRSCWTSADHVTVKLSDDVHGWICPVCLCYNHITTSSTSGSSATVDCRTTCIVCRSPRLAANANNDNVRHIVSHCVMTSRDDVTTLQPLQPTGQCVTRHSTTHHLSAGNDN